MRTADVIAGLSVSGLMLPEAVAYAAIAGLPTQRAVIAAIAGCLAYPLIGRSRFAIVSPTSSAAAILAATLAAMPAGAADKAVIATAAVLLAGLIFIGAALARIGGLTNLISRPVLRGFAFGIAVTIIVKQLPTVAGVSIKVPEIFHLALALVQAVGQWNLYSLTAGIIALISLLTLKRVPAVPGALIVLAIGVAASYGFDLAGHGVAMVGTIDVSPSSPRLPQLSFADWSRLLPYVVPLVLILFAESWGTINGLATAHGDTVTANRELGALGLANFASALVQGMPVGAGFSAGSAAESAGSQSRATGIFAALGLTTLVVLAATLVAKLPEPVLAAVVIGTLSHALKPAPFLRLWRLKRDFYVALGAAASVLVFGVMNGMLIAVGLSLIALIRRIASPRLVQLGRLNGSHDFVDIARHPAATLPPGTTIWRPAEPLFFANAAPILDHIALEVRGKAAKSVIISLEETFDLDSSGLDALIAFDAAMIRDGVHVQLARVHDHVRDVLTSGAATGLLARSSYSVDDAVSALPPTAGKE